MSQRRALTDYGDVILRLDLDVAYYDHNGLPDTPRIRAARRVLDAIREWEAACAADFPPPRSRCAQCGHTPDKVIHDLTWGGGHAFVSSEEEG